MTLVITGAIFTGYDFIKSVTTAQRSDITSIAKIRVVKDIIL